MRHRIPSSILGVLVVLTGACTGDDGGDTGAGEDGSAGDSDADGPVHEIPVDLVAPELWIADPVVDPMPVHEPTDVDCALGFKDEFGVFEVDTGLCNYGVFVQPNATDVAVGELIEVVITHDDLIALEPAQGHVAIAIGGRLVYEVYVPIPAPYGLVQGEWITDVAIPAGTPVALHLHNHGYNSWRLVSIKASTP
ncbi:MAG: hypothetical protein IAG13_09995 [Deltaproteobacteria bacterium]|nr:hypothetical protein [Nannocystaceae bacterium]